VLRAAGSDFVATGGAGSTRTSGGGGVAGDDGLAVDRLPSTRADVGRGETWESAIAATVECVTCTGVSDRRHLMPMPRMTTRKPRTHTATAADQYGAMTLNVSTGI